jgi:hypothetical protein
MYERLRPNNRAAARPLRTVRGTDKAAEICIRHAQVKAKGNPYLRFVRNSLDIMLEELCLLSQSRGIAFPSGSKTTMTTIRGVGRALLALLIVEGIRKIDPEAAVLAEHAPDFIKDTQQMADKIIRMGLMAKLTFSPVWPAYRCGIAAQKIEWWRSQTGLHYLVRQDFQPSQCITRKNMN